jgi:hypothetical protein
MLSVLVYWEISAWQLIFLRIRPKNEEVRAIFELIEKPRARICPINDDRESGEGKGVCTF